MYIEFEFEVNKVKNLNKSQNCDLGLNKNQDIIFLPYRPTIHIWKALLVASFCLDF